MSMVYFQNIPISGDTIEDMKFWFGYDYETSSAVDIFKDEKINEEGDNTIRNILQYEKSLEAICAVSSTFWKFVQNYPTYTTPNTQCRTMHVLHVTVTCLVG